MHDMRRTTLEPLETRTVLSGTAIVQPLAQSDHYGDGNDWALNAVHAPEVWAHGSTGSNVLVAVIDSGIDLQHPDLVDSIWSNLGEIAGNGIDDDANGYIDDFHGWDFVGDDALPADEAGHGTQVAGVVVAVRNDIGATGVAYDALVMPIRVLDSRGNGSQFDIASGIRYAVDNGADIINLSLGSRTGSQRVSRAIEHAFNHDVLIVAASGNAAEPSPDFPASYSSQFSNVLSVGAFDHDLQLASFSNQVGTSGALQIDAPGVGIYTTKMGGGFRSGSGTSFATPMVSGTAAPHAFSQSGIDIDGSTHCPGDGRASPTITATDSLGGADAAATLGSIVQTQSVVAIPLPGDTDADGLVGLSDFLSISRNYRQAVDSRRWRPEW